MQNPQPTRRLVVAELSDAVRNPHHDSWAPRCLVLTAGPGSGKTHILDELFGAPLLTGSVVTVRRTRADELSWRQPFSVAAALLRREIPTPLPDSFAGDLYNAVDDLCARGPLILVVDDAHHADAASLELLSRLAGAARDLPLTLVLARRRLPRREQLEILLSRPGVREWELPPMSAAELTDLAADTLGAAPGPGVDTVLDAAGGNPMHAAALLRSLRHSGAVHIHDGVARIDADAARSADPQITGVIAAHLALLDPAARALTQRLAVWGGPATLAELAAIDGMSPVGLLDAAQTAIDAGVITGDSDSVAFTHDLFAEVTYERIAPAIRAVLHHAVADHPAAQHHPQVIAHHTLASGADAHRSAAAVVRAQSELSPAPAMTVELLGALPEAVTASHRSMHLDLAEALTRTGQFTRAAEVAEQGLAQASTVEQITALHGTLLFAVITKGDTARARELIDATLALPIDEETVAELADLRRYVGIVEGTEPVPRQPFFDLAEASSRPVPGVIAEALRRLLVGDLTEALQLILVASQRHAAESSPAEVGTSDADIWMPIIEQYTHGARGAAQVLESVAGLRVGRGADWMIAYHEFIQGGICFDLGRIDDAIVSWDAGLERCATAEMGWTSMAVGGRITAAVLRGDLADAAARLDAWSAGGLPDQLGIPMVDAAQIQLLEATRKMRPAADAARQVWDRAVAHGAFMWLPEFGLECARIGVRAGDRALLNRLATDIAALPAPQATWAARDVDLIAAMTATVLSGADPMTVVAAGRDAADANEKVEFLVSQARALEEAACAAALAGDRPLARELAEQTLVLTQGMGAVTMSQRLCSRLRPHGLRLSPGASRSRPRTGWESLTRTERTVAELVGEGCSGPQIAQRLHISTRTVQTHVSHALTKLGVGTRVELAAFVAGR